MNEQLPVPQQPNILHVFERALRDPSLPIERSREIYALHREIEADLAEREYIRVRGMMEKEFDPVAKDASNPQTKSKYATLAQVIQAIRPIYSKYGIHVDFDTADSPKGETWIKVTATLAHEAGYTRQYHIDMPADGKGAQGRDVMTRTHATGSAVSYGRRYLLLMIFNLAVAGEDDDGNAAGRRVNPVGVGGPEEYKDNIPAHDSPDRIQPDPAEKEKPRMKQRPVSAELQEELNACQTLAHLRHWMNLPETKERVAQMRPDWRDLFASQVNERLQELKSPTHRALEESVWLEELEGAYENVDDMSAFHVVDEHKFHPIVNTVSQEARNKAHEIRQRRIDEMTDRG